MVCILRVSELRRKHLFNWRIAHLHRFSSTSNKHSQLSSLNDLAPRVIVSGIQPTGTPHLGNYLGALRPWLRLQNESSPTTKLFFSIVDLHAITIPQDKDMLRIWKQETLISLLALGLDPRKCVIFYQSTVSLIASTALFTQSRDLAVFSLLKGNLQGSTTHWAYVDLELCCVHGLSVKDDTVEG